MPQIQVSSYLEDKIAKWVKGTAFPAAPASIKLALSSANPTDDGTGLVEPGGGYARQTFTLAAPVTTEADGAQTSNTAGITFSGTGTVTHAAIFDVSGNMLFYGPLEVSRTFVGADTVSFDIGDVKAALTGGFSKYLAEAIINWVRGTTMPAAPASLKLALSRANPLRDNTAINEPTDTTGYARKAVTMGTLTTTVGVGTSFSNSAPVVFGPSVDSNWGAITHWALYPPSTNDLIAYGALAVPKTVNIGAGFGLNTGAFALLIA